MTGKERNELRQRLYNEALTAKYVCDRCKIPIDVRILPSTFKLVGDKMYCGETCYTRRSQYMRLKDIEAIRNTHVYNQMKEIIRNEEANNTKKR